MKKIILLGLLAIILPAIASASIDTNLYYGIKNKAAVQELQEFLVDKGFFTMAPTGNFYSLTLKAVKAYQASVGVPSTGYVGTLTRKAINDDLAANLEGSNGQAIEDTGSLPPVQINQPTQLPAPSQPAPTGNPAPAQTPMPEPFVFNPEVHHYPSDLTVSIAEQFDKCILIIKDENGNIVRNQDTWFKDVQGKYRQVYSMGTKGQHTYEITCSKAGFETTTKTGSFPKDPE